MIFGLFFLGGGATIHQAEIRQESDFPIDQNSVSSAGAGYAVVSVDAVPRLFGMSSGVSISGKINTSGNTLNPPRLT